MAKKIKNVSNIIDWRDVKTVDHYNSSHLRVIKDGDMRTMIKLMKKMRIGEIPVQVFYFEGMYIWIFFRDKKEGYESKYLHAFSSADFVPSDICFMLYDAFFDIDDIDCQIVMIGHEIGHFKTTYFRGPQYGYDRRRREYLRRGDVAPDEIEADKYAHRYMPYKYKECLYKMADYADQDGGFHPNASKELRLRASKMYK